MKVSVAMCTYNGAAHLQQQLDSIAWQTRQPDELVIVDDMSKDGSVEIVREFSRSTKIPVKVFINEKNIGSSANFSKATALCSGDLIFWADQDDVWHANKIERSVAAFEEFPSIGALICNANVVDSQLNPLGYSLWDAVGFDEARQVAFNSGQAFEVLLHRNVATGMTMALRAEYRSLVLPVSSRWHHDGWAALLISAVSPLYALAEKLVDYRQHSNQLIGVRKETLLQKSARYYERWRVRREEGYQRYMATVEDLSPVLDRLEQRLPQQCIARKKVIDDKIEHFRTRALMRKRRFEKHRLIMREIRSSNYASHSLGYKSIIEDLFF